MSKELVELFRRDRFGRYYKYRPTERFISSLMRVKPTDVSLASPKPVTVSSLKGVGDAVGDADDTGEAEAEGAGLPRGLGVDIRLGDGDEAVWAVVCVTHASEAKATIIAPRMQ